MNDLDKIRKILRDNHQHERECGVNTTIVEPISGMTMRSPRPCDCYLSEDD